MKKTVFRRAALERLASPEQLDQLMQLTTPKGWLALLALCALLVAAMVWALWGTVYTTIGANLGAAAAFLIGRYAARDMVERQIENNAALGRIDDGVKRHGWRMLMITRLVPIFPFNIQNYVYGLSDIGFGTYVLVSLVCMVPGTIAYNFAAGSVRTGNLGTTLWYLGIAAVFFVLLSLLPGWLKKKYGTEVE